MNRQTANEIYLKHLTTTWPTHDGSQKLPVNARLLRHMQETAQRYPNTRTTLQDAIDGGRRVLFWSDQHFYHANIIQFSNRPDTDVESMGKRLTRNYFDSVAPDDVVVWGGDCAFGPAQRARDFFVGTNFPGYKILILGNHDFEKKNAQWRDMNIFDEILLCEGLTVELDGEKKDILVSHYPVDTTLLGHSLNLHGHIHEKNFGLPHINMSVEAIDYRPQTLEYCLRIAQKLHQRVSP